MIEIGRLCVKIAGRDARKKCVIVDTLENNYVLIDGETRRGKCNITHIEPINQKLELKKSASKDEVIAAFKTIGIEITKSKPKESKPKPSKIRKTKESKGKQ